MTGAFVRSCWERVSIVRRRCTPAVVLATMIVATGLQGCSSDGIVQPRAGFAGGVQPRAALAGFDRVSVAAVPRPQVVAAVPRPRDQAVYRRAVPVKRGLRVGRPYQIAGRFYVPRHQPRYNRVGLASWYGGEFVGRPTASGEIYDARAMTAAHKTLPLNSLVRVTNLANGRAVTVRINDRGPFVKDRIIDLSRNAAERLEFAHHGLARVRVQVLETVAMR